MPRRTIYSADQASPSTYDTTFEDFLNSLPQYVNQFQENQIKLGRQQLEDKRYEDEKTFKDEKFKLDKANKDRDYAFKFHQSATEGLTPKQKLQYMTNVMEKDERIKGTVDLKNMTSVVSGLIEQENSYGVLDSKIDAFRGTSLRDNFDNYGDIADAYSELQELEASFRGTNLESKVSEDLEYLGSLKKELETKSGKEYSEKDMQPTQLRNYRKLDKANNVNLKSLNDAMDELSKYGALTKDGKWSMRPFDRHRDLDEKTHKMGFHQALSAFNSAKGRYEANNDKFAKFTKQNNLIYPEVRTNTEIQEETTRLADDANKRQEWLDENEKYINTNPELAGMMLDYLNSDQDAGAFNKLQDETNQFLQFDKDLKELEESVQADTGEKPPAIDVVKGKTGIGRFSIDGKQAIISFDDVKEIGNQKHYFVEKEGEDGTWIPESDLPKDIKMEDTAPDAPPPDKPVVKSDEELADQEIEEIDQELTKIQKEYEDESKLNEYLSQLAQKKGLTVQAKPIGPGNVSLAPGMVGDQPLEQLDFGQPELFPEKPVPSSPERIKSLEIKDTKGSNLDIDNLPKLNKQLTSMVKEVERVEKGYFKDDSPDKKSQAKIEDDLRRLSISIDALPDNTKNRNLKMTVNQILKQLTASKKKIRKVKQSKRRTR
jgi:hypothetical protein